MHFSTKKNGEADFLRHLQAEIGAGKRVAWLLSGGSNVAIEVRIAHALTGGSLRSLVISLVDERYGLPGHAYSNWAALEKAGFPFERFTSYPVLVAGLSLQETAARMSHTLETIFQSSDRIIGQLGIGLDGHVAGILPHSLAARATGLATSYHSQPYDRVTMTFAALRRLHEVSVFAYGPEKEAVLRRLNERSDLALAVFPAQILRHIPSVCIYNDYIGEL